MRKILIVVPGFVKWSREPIEILKNAGFHVVEKDYGLAGLNKDEEEFCRIIKDVEAVIVTAMDKVTRRVIESGEKLKMIAIRSAGFEGTDLKAATDHGVLVTNNPGANRQAVADMTIGLMLSVSRRINLMDRGMRLGKFDDIRFNSKDIYKKQLGITGLGNIGKAVAERATGFKMDIIYHDIVAYPEFADFHHIQKVTFEQLLKESDIISLHVPIDDSTRNMISVPQIRLMKDDAILINTCRGGVIDEEAIYAALLENKLYGYGTDVHANEPPNFMALLKHDHVVSTPHIAGVSEDGLNSMAMKTTEKIVQFLVKHQIPDDVLNPAVIPFLGI